MQDAIVLLEKEVSEYEEALTQKEIAQKERDRACGVTQRSLDELLEIFTDSTKLNNELLLIKGNIKVVGKVLSDLT